MTKKILRTYLAFQFTSNLVMHTIMVTYVLFLLDKGLNLFTVNQVNFCFMIAILVFELPTGVFADIFGRRKSVALAWIFFGFAGIVYFFSDCFWHFITAEILAALGMSFQSGSLEAWVKDSMDHSGSTIDDQVVFSKGEKTKWVGSILGGFLGGWISQYDLALPWLLQGLGSFAAAFVAFKIMKEDYFKRTVFSWSTLWQKLKSHLKMSFSHGMKNKIFFLLVVVQVGVFFGFQGINMQWSKYFQDSLGHENLKYICAGIHASLWLGAWLGEKLAGKRVSHKMQLFWAQISVAFFIVIASWQMTPWLLAIFFWLHEVGRGLQRPVRLAYMNQHISSQERATLLSFDSMFMKLGGAGGLMLTGYLANNYSIGLSWQVVAICIGSFSFLLFLLPNGGKK